MRYSNTIVLALAAVATAQSATNGDAPTTTVVITESSEAARITECLADCGESDVNCKAACVGVPSPNDDQANDNTACATECDQGDGSPEDTEAFGNCLLKCRGEHYFSEGPNGGHTPQPTGAGSDSSDDAPASGSAASTTTQTVATGSQTTLTGTQTPAASGSDASSSDSASESGSASSSADAAEETNEDSGAMTLGAFSSFSLFGLVAAAFL